MIATRAEVELHLGRGLTPIEVGQLTAFAAALDAEVLRATGLGPAGSGATVLTLRDPACTVRVPGVLNGEPTVTVDGTDVAVQAWFRSGEVRLCAPIPAGVGVSVVAVRADMPAQVTAWVAGRLAAAFRAQCSAAAMAPTIGRGVTGQAIDGTSLSFAGPSEDTLGMVHASASRFLTLTDGDIRALRRMTGVGGAWTAETIR